jgi:hypothetical protein
MSRTRAYPSLRISGAFFAGFAAVGWIIARLFDVHNAVDILVSIVAHYADRIAVGLFLTSFACWQLHNLGDQEAMASTP